MTNRHRAPDPPLALINETTDLLLTLEATVTNLREFTERLQQATAAEEEDQ